MNNVIVTALLGALIFAILFVLVFIGLLVAGWLTPWALLLYVPVATFVFVATALVLIDTL